MVKIANIFGESGKGIHKYRFGNVAIIDYVFTIILAMVISIFTPVPLTISTNLLIILSMILHRIFGVKTTTQTFLENTTKSFISLFKKK